jgi:hypothetical protein
MHTEVEVALKEVGWEGADLIWFILQALVNTVMNFSGSMKGTEFVELLNNC